ncbi:PPM2 [Candida theae]|uniref:tRNA wybutosine-synthesizing protein 4 n=1 Tax=Candida theae TaxID=1198502 RepID=A0AAD5G0P9_9ASCO|nr:PPM2 [Candida theae]KAI5966662.1 PPM2 [Candida theae]
MPTTIKQHTIPGQTSKQSQQKRKEKDQRRKHYDDQQVQGTNNSSIVSKRSVEKLYFPKVQPELGTWFSHFVPSSKKDRRSPAINRGYWIRMESIRRTVYKIIEKSWREGGECSAAKQRVVNVVNLGCGFDPLPFQMLSMRNGEDCAWGNGCDFNFFDIDYPDLVDEKLSLIKKSNEIEQLIGDGVQKDSMYKLNTNNYKLIGCDLKNLSQYQHIVDQLFSKSKDSNGKALTIFIAEVSLAYMKPEFANPVIEISSKVANSNFIILEQIMPDGANNAFATKMLYHFAHLRSPIQCVESYPTKSQQLQRFKQYYNFAEVRNLFENWKWLIDGSESDDDNEGVGMKQKLMQVEEFDEWEEFILFCQHYIVLHATNDAKQLVYDDKLVPDFSVDTGNEQKQKNDVFEVDDEVKFSIDERFETNLDLLQVKFPACDSLNGKVYVQGGLKQTRTNETVVVDYAAGTIGRQQIKDEHNLPQPRMCHSLTNVCGDLILVGGRTRPNDVNNDVYKFDGRDSTRIGQDWTRIGQDSPRQRHAAVAVRCDQVLLFGGLLEPSHTTDLFALFNTTTNKIQPLEIRGDYIGNLYSAAMVYNQDKNEGYIYGGFHECQEPKVNDRLYKFTIDYENFQIRLDVVGQHLMFARIGSQGQLIHNGTKLLIVGGVCSETILTHRTNIVTLQLDNNPAASTFKSVDIPLGVSLKHPPILIGFGLAPISEHLSLIVGGGAVCYSFGSCYNCVYRLEY